MEIPKPKGDTYKPQEQYTDRLKNILKEYRDEQIFYEIIQNSDDSEQFLYLIIIHITVRILRIFLNPSLQDFKDPHYYRKIKRKILNH